MRRWDRLLTFLTARRVRVFLPKAALTQIFDECDCSSDDETGGRVIGFYSAGPDGWLTIRIGGLIAAGPRAKRSPVSLFQDGVYQIRVFRYLERFYPEVEHLGNWHTHHVNGLPALSTGDLVTYHRTVNHPLHNTSFFYALLVTSKRRSSGAASRYRVKHYLFRRGDGHAYRIARSRVQITNQELMWPQCSARSSSMGEVEQ